MCLVPLRRAVIFAVAIINKPRGLIIIFHARLSGRDPVRFGLFGL
jgi:hypothetical protein